MVGPQAIDPRYDRMVKHLSVAGYEFNLAEGEFAWLRDEVGRGQWEPETVRALTLLLGVGPPSLMWEPSSARRPAGGSDREQPTCGQRRTHSRSRSANHRRGRGPRPAYRTRRAIRRQIWSNELGHVEPSKRRADRRQVREHQSPDVEAVLAAFDLYVHPSIGRVLWNGDHRSDGCCTPGGRYAGGHRPRGHSRWGEWLAVTGSSSRRSAGGDQPSARLTRRWGGRGGRPWGGRRLPGREHGPRPRASLQRR